MKINIIGHHLEITDGLKDHIGKKTKKNRGAFSRNFRD